MSADSLTRREVSLRLLSLLPTAALVGRAAAATGQVPTPADSEISRNRESIHQEVLIKASRARVYQALTEAKQFSKVTDFSIPGAATAINPEVGGTFSLFGGVISGRHIEMLPGERLVQAWREKDWEPGLYSIVRFQLNDAGNDTRLVFDHTGFPQGKAESLAAGWKSHYWEALRKYLA